MTLFDAVSPDYVFQKVLDGFYNGQYDLKTLNYMDLISATLYFNVFYKYLSNKKLLRILPCQKFHLS